MHHAVRMMAGRTPVVAVGVTFSPVPGSYSADDGGMSEVVSYTITASQAVVWTWSRTGSTASANVESGSSAASITFTMLVGSTDRLATFTVNAEGQTWTISLYNTGVGGGGGL